MGNDAVKLGDRLVHRVEQGGAFRVRHAGNARVPEDAALPHVHRVEDGAEYRRVGTDAPDMRDREASFCEAGEHACFAIDRMSILEQVAGRLLAEHVARAGCHQPVGRVGLAAFELLDRERAGKAVDRLAHPRFKRGHVEFVALTNRNRAAVEIG